MTDSLPWHDYDWPQSVPLSVRRAFSSMQPVCSEQALTQAVDRLAVQVSVALQDRDPVFIVVMQGGLVFAGMLMRRVVLPAAAGFVRVSRYGDETSGGTLTWGAKDVPELSGRCVVFIDDILDEGKTLVALNDWARAEGAAEVHNAVLVLREGLSREVPANTWHALGVGPGFLIGCGMDIAGYGRNLPALFRVPDAALADVTS